MNAEEDLEGRSFGYVAIVAQKCLRIAFGVSSVGNSRSSVSLVLQMQMMQVPLSVALRREGSCGGLNYRLVRPPPFRLRGTLLPARHDSHPSLFNVIRFYVPTSALVDKTEL